MSDERQRELERQAASGDLDAKAKLLIERVRRDELHEDRLRLAAYLGDEAALLALGGDVPDEVHSLNDWILGLSNWGTDTLANGIVAAVKIIDREIGRGNGVEQTCPNDGGQTGPSGCDHCAIGPDYVGELAREWLHVPRSKLIEQINAAFWIPEFVPEKVRKAVRLKLVPQALRKV